MKKLLIILASSLLLVGCSDAYTTIKNKNETIIKIGNTNITSGDIYTSMLMNYGDFEVYNDAVNKILDMEVETSDEMLKKVDEEIEKYKTFYPDNWSEVLNEHIKMYNFADIEEFKQAIIYNEKSVEAIKKYIEEDFAAITENLNPKLAILLTFSEVEKAKTALEELKNGIDPSEVGTIHGSTTSGNPTIFTIENMPAQEVDSILNTSDSDSEYVMVPSNSNPELTYIVKLIESDPNNFKEQIINELSNSSSLKEAAFENYFDKHKFSIYDKNLYDNFNNNFPGYLK